MVALVHIVVGWETSFLALLTIVAFVVEEITKSLMNKIVNASTTQVSDKETLLDWYWKTVSELETLMIATELGPQVTD